MFLKTYLKYLPLPLLVAAYPILFLFGQNASALNLASLEFPLAVSLLVAGSIYTFFCLLQRKPLNASLSAVVFMIVYYLYGYFFHLLVNWDRFPVHQFVLLPLLVAATIYVANLLIHLKRPLAAVLQKVLLIVSLALVMYNTFGVTVPVEATKALVKSSPARAVKASTTPDQKKPDIYYIIFDEYAGFDAMHSFWHDNSVDQFETFLKQNHFFVATGSRSPTLNTGSEIATRLNLQPYPEKLPAKVKLDAIDHNQVMQVLKANGYTTMAIDMAFQGIDADVNHPI